MVWGVLIVAAFAEAIFAIAVKESAGFTKMWPSILAISMVVADYLLLGYIFQQIPLETAYLVWTGLSAVLVCIYGIYMYGDQVTSLRVLCMMLVLIGAAGLRSVS